MIQDIEISKIISNNIINDRASNEVNNSIIDLAASIKKYGLIQPIVLKKIEDDKYQVVCGQKRILAYKLLSREKIPSLVKDFSDIQSELFTIIDENSKRDNLNFYEKYLLNCKTLYILSLKNDTKVLSEVLSNEDVLLENTFKYLKEINILRLAKNTQQANAVQDYYVFIKNCELIDISHRTILDNLFLQKTNEMVLKFLTGKKISFQIASILHKIQNEEYFSQLVSYIEASNKKITLTEIKNYIKTKNDTKQKEVSKEEVISLISNITDKKSLIYLERVIKKLELKNKSKEKGKK